MNRHIFPIESPRRLAHLLGFGIADLEALAATASTLYGSMYLLVPGKKARLIRVPKPELRSAQRRILSKLFCEFVPHPCSFGGIKGRSPLSNAEMHLGRRFFLKIDVRKFYPNAHHRWVHRFFESRLGCSPPVARILRRLLTLDSGLPQGTCTSPALADQLMKPVDRIFASVFTDAGAVYTRFVDDITVSAEFRLRRYLPLMDRVLRKFGLQMHLEEKVEEFSPSDDPIVTGVSCGKFLGAPSLYISKISSELKQALSFSTGESEIPPPYCRETYLGIIQYLQRFDKRAAGSLGRVFNSVNWTALAGLGLPGKRGVLVKNLSPQ